MRARLHDRAADLLGVHRTRTDRLAFRAYAKTVTAGTAFAPRSMRYLPGARLAAKNDQTYMDTTSVTTH
ncbi:hypothetical protein ACFXNW_23385 [Nocardia sp. NPDC059180]|uniref:hypothetical protein n=1 Tax=Nocardia sp. NPDC059180 TaxID=3346761 RepID=UPI0036CC0E3D